MKKLSLIPLCLILTIAAILFVCAPPIIPLYPPTNLTYVTDNLITYKNNSISPLIPTFSGSADTFFVTPSFPEQLIINPTTGEISGKPLNLLAKTSYTITVLNTYLGESTSFPFSLTVIDSPKITAQPEQVQSTLGARAEFFVVAAGMGLKYKWMRNATEIPSATSPALVLSTISATDAATYFCIVTDTLGTQLISSSVKCILQTPTAAQITVQPEPREAIIGTKASFSVLADGTNLVYAWYKNDSLLAGKISPLLVIDSTKENDSGLYYVIVKNELGSIKSDTARLKVLKNNYSIKISGIGEGIISFHGKAIPLDTTLSIIQGTSDSITFQAKPGSVIDSVKIDSVLNTLAKMNEKYLFFNVNKSHSISINFSKQKFKINLTVNDTSAGSVTKSRSDSIFYWGDTITLSAANKNGYYFTGWTGNIDDTLKSHQSISTSISSSITLVANFAKLGRFTINATSNPIVGGTIVRIPDSSQYVKNSQVKLIAKPTNGYKFIGWTGGISTDTLVVTIDTNKTLTASFEKIRDTLRMVTSPQGGGIVSLSGEMLLAELDTLPITAIPNTSEGYAFVNWHKISGIGKITFSDSTKSTTTVRISGGSAVIAAIFIKPDQYSLTVSYATNRPEGGDFSIKQQKAKYAFGDTVQLIAHTYPGYTFDSWSGDIPKTSDTLVTVIIKGNTSIKVLWQPNELVYKDNINNNVAIDSATQPFLFNLVLKSDPGIIRPNYMFINWNTKSDGSGISYPPGIVGSTGVGGVNYVIQDFNDTLYAQWASLKDIDGNLYTTVKIGKQVWMVENFKATKYRDGTPIPNFCWYNNDSTNKSIYGALYNWYAFSPPNDLQFTPEGWHVPSTSEFDTLKNYLIANKFNYDSSTTGEKCAKALASKSYWQSSSIPGAIGNNLDLNNKSGFNAQPGGWHSYSGFVDIGKNCYWWTTTPPYPAGSPMNDDQASSKSLATNGVAFNASTGSSSMLMFKRFGFSVRLILNN